MPEDRLYGLSFNLHRDVKVDAKKIFGNIFFCTSQLKISDWIPHFDQLKYSITRYNEPSPAWVIQENEPGSMDIFGALVVRELDILYLEKVWQLENYTCEKHSPRTVHVVS